jgi:DNA-binding NarL/FixJ family response regulator
MKNHSGAKPLKILIAAPNNILARGIKSVLAPNDYFFHEYLGRADELLEKSKVAADLLIIDADTPESFGTGIIKKMKAKYPGLKIIIVNKQHYLPDTVKSIMKAGADACVSKYAELTPLREAIESVRQGKKYLCPLCARALAESFLTKAPKKALIELSKQEEKVINFLAHEYYNSEIADELHISLRTAETHRKNIMKKIGVRNLAGIAIYAIKNKFYEMTCALFIYSQYVLSE